MAYSHHQKFNRNETTSCINEQLNYINGKFNPLKVRGINCLHLAIQV